MLQPLLRIAPRANTPHQASAIGLGQRREEPFKGLPLLRGKWPVSSRHSPIIRSARCSGARRRGVRASHWPGSPSAPGPQALPSPTGESQRAVRTGPVRWRSGDGPEAYCPMLSPGPRTSYDLRHIARLCPRTGDSRGRKARSRARDRPPARRAHGPNALARRPDRPGMRFCPGAFPRAPAPYPQRAAVEVLLHHAPDDSRCCPNEEKVEHDRRGQVYHLQHIRSEIPVRIVEQTYVCQHICSALPGLQCTPGGGQCFTTSRREWLAACVTSKR